MTERSVAQILSDFAAEIDAAPVRVVGMSMDVRGGSGGSVVGVNMSVVGGGPGTRTVGINMSVSGADYQQKASALTAELREAAAIAAAGEAPKSWVKSLLQRAAGLGNRALDTIVTTTTAALVRHYGNFN